MVVQTVFMAGILSVYAKKTASVGSGWVLVCKMGKRKGFWWLVCCLCFNFLLAAAGKFFQINFQNDQ